MTNKRTLRKNKKGEGDNNPVRSLRKVQRRSTKKEKSLRKSNRRSTKKEKSLRKVRRSTKKEKSLRKVRRSMNKRSMRKVRRSMKRRSTRKSKRRSLQKVNRSLRKQRSLQKGGMKIPFVSGDDELKEVKISGMFIDGGFNDDDTISLTDIEVRKIQMDKSHLSSSISKMIDILKKDENKPHMKDVRSLVNKLNKENVPLVTNYQDLITLYNTLKEKKKDSSKDVSELDISILQGIVDEADDSYSTIYEDGKFIDVTPQNLTIKKLKEMYNLVLGKQSKAINKELMDVFDDKMKEIIYKLQDSKYGIKDKADIQDDFSKLTEYDLFLKDVDENNKVSDTTKTSFRLLNNEKGKKANISESTKEEEDVEEDKEDVEEEDKEDVEEDKEDVEEEDVEEEEGDKDEDVEEDKEGKQIGGDMTDEDNKAIYEEITRKLTRIRDTLNKRYNRVTEAQGGLRASDTINNYIFSKLRQFDTLESPDYEDDEDVNRIINSSVSILNTGENKNELKKYYSTKQGMDSSISIELYLNNEADIYLDIASNVVAQLMNSEKERLSRLESTLKRLNTTYNVEITKLLSYCLQRVKDFDTELKTFMDKSKMYSTNTKELVEKKVNEEIKTYLSMKFNSIEEGKSNRNKFDVKIEALEEKTNKIYQELIADYKSLKRWVAQGFDSKTVRMPVKLVSPKMLVSMYIRKEKLTGFHKQLEEIPREYPELTTQQYVQLKEDKLKKKKELQEKIYKTLTKRLSYSEPTKQAVSEPIMKSNKKILSEKQIHSYLRDLNEGDKEKKEQMEQDIKNLRNTN